ncbi:glutamine synthetase [Penicillium longicatenatum]|nr:glutamine synthetase [Penicillium longicatenatum]
MYSTLAAILGAGLLGLAGKESLIWPDMGVRENQDSDCSEPLPQCLEDSLAVLDADTGSLATIIGRPMIDHYINIKRFEIAQMKKMKSKTVRELLIELF